MNSWSLTKEVPYTNEPQVRVLQWWLANVQDWGCCYRVPLPVDPLTLLPKLSLCEPEGKELMLGKEMEVPRVRSTLTLHAEATHTLCSRTDWALEFIFPLALCPC